MKDTHKAKMQAEASGSLFARQLQQYYEDPNMALGFAQGSVFRALQAHDIEIRVVDDHKVYYSIKKQDRLMVVAELDTRTKTLIHRDGCSKNQDKLITAHAALYSDEPCITHEKGNTSLGNMMSTDLGAVLVANGAIFTTKNS
jgi:hypothetical protein